MCLPVLGPRGQPSSGAWRLLRHRTVGRHLVVVLVAATAVAVVAVLLIVLLLFIATVIVLVPVTAVWHRGAAVLARVVLSR